MSDRTDADLINELCSNLAMNLLAIVDRRNQEDCRFAKYVESDLARLARAIAENWSCSKPQKPVPPDIMIVRDDETSAEQAKRRRDDTS
jgi:hypothetical protein